VQCAFGTDKRDLPLTDRAVGKSASSRPISLWLKSLQTATGRDITAVMTCLGWVSWLVCGETPWKRRQRSARLCSQRWSFTWSCHGGPHQWRCIELLGTKW